MSRFNHLSEDPQPSDEEIWLALKDGDRTALEILFRRHYEGLFQYGLKMCGRRAVTEDCIQDLFHKIWRHRNNLSEEVKGVKTYLWTALRRRLVTKLKNNRRYRKRVDNGRSKIYPAMKLSPEELIVKNEMAISKSKKLTHALDQLSPRQHEVLYLKFYEGMSYDEIEQIISISYQTARNHICEALKVLRVFMTESSQNI